MPDLPDSILVTGGAGFVGSSLAVHLKTSNPEMRVMVMDNLRRTGSVLNLPRLAASGVIFHHGDIRSAVDLGQIPEFDLLIDCSADPSVHAGHTNSPIGVIETNLAGTVNCLEEARTRGAAFLFLSTSRIFSIVEINNLPFIENISRFDWDLSGNEIGVTASGISESFSLRGARSFYGATKLACEHLIQEYVHAYGMKALVNRCGLIAGPWQMGKEEQGVVALWVARHAFRKPLRYHGFGGHGKQVRDVLHIDDLSLLVAKQIAEVDDWDGGVFNVGGGVDHVVSLRELTDLCIAATSNRIPIESQPVTSAVDIRIYITDNKRVSDRFSWKPVKTPINVVHDIARWIESAGPDLAATLRW